MGKKLSKMSCVKTNSVSSMRKKTRRTKSVLSETTADKETQDLIFVDHSASSLSHAVEISPQRRSTSQVGSVTVDCKANRGEVILMPTDELRKLETIEECEEYSTENNCDQGIPCPIQKTQLLPDTSKKIGNSIELLPCPDMSIIAFLSDRREIAPGVPISELPSPNSGSSGEDFTNVTPFANDERSAVELSNGPLLVPPNSINSQFISDITALDSLEEIGHLPDDSRDSVFAHDLSYVSEHCLDAVYFANFGAGRVLLNNNSLITGPDYAVVKTEINNAKSGNSIEISDGPGLDSDFGASAGIEMRIVSSDFSSTGNTAYFATDRERASIRRTTLDVPQHFRNRRSTSDAYTTVNRPYRSTQLVTRTIPLVEMISTHRSDRQLSFGVLVREPNRRSASVGAPEAIFQATMEWDPYDMHSEIGQWREYYIPGVSYPNHPLLCPEEYWL